MWGYKLECGKYTIDFLNSKKKKWSKLHFRDSNIKNEDLAIGLSLEKSSPACLFIWMRG